MTSCQNIRDKMKERMDKIKNHKNYEHEFWTKILNKNSDQEFWLRILN